MHREFTSQVESIVTEGGQPVVKFVTSVGGYPVRGEPQEILATLRDSLRTGQPVRVTCDATTLEIVDAVLERRLPRQRQPTTLT